MIAFISIINLLLALAMIIWIWELHSRYEQLFRTFEYYSIQRGIDHQQIREYSSRIEELTKLVSRLDTSSEASKNKISQLTTRIENLQHRVNNPNIQPN